MWNYNEALDVFNNLPFNEKVLVALKEEALYRYVLKGKAFIDITPYRGQNNIGFINIAILPQYRRNGLSKVLCDKAKEDCKLLGIDSLIWRCKKINVPSYKSAISNNFELISQDENEFTLKLSI